jgi:MEMO1 family protein
MLEIVIQTIQYYFKYLREPSANEIEVSNKNLLSIPWCVFITLYKNGEIRWAWWNVKEIEKNIVEETIKNTVEALTLDKRFSPIKMDEVKDIKIRIDLIKDRHILEEGKMIGLDPVKSGVICIKKDYDKLAVILPNISPRLLTGSDFIPVLKEKLQEKEFAEKDYIIYEITTQSMTNF